MKVLIQRMPFIDNGSYDNINIHILRKCGIRSTFPRE